MGKDYVCRLLGHNKDHELSDVVGCMPRQEVPSQNYNGVDRKEDRCGHMAFPARRVCSEGVDTGRRFLSCSEGRSCGYVKWIDKPWQGRERSVIADLVCKKEVLEQILKEKDGEIEATKEKHRMEKKMIGRMHKD